MQLTKKALSGREKVAILIMSLGPDVASQIYQHLTEDEIEMITYQIASLSNVNAKTREKVLEEFHDLAVANDYITIGGVKYAREVLEKALGSERADRVLNKLSGSLQVKPFAFAKKLDSTQILTFLQNEHPQTIALVLAYLEPVQASEILTSLPEDLQIEVSRRIAMTNSTSMEAVYEIEAALETKLSTSQTTEDMKIGGIGSIVQIINGVPRSTEKNILDSLAKVDPELTEAIRNQMFVFEDIVKIDSRTLQRIIRDIEQTQLQLALKGASDEVKEAFFNNMSKRMAETIQEAMEYMGAVRLRDVEDAQQSIVNVIRRLEDSGEIILARGGDDDVIE